MNTTLLKAIQSRGYTAESFEEGLIVIAKKGKKELLFIDSYTPLVPYTAGLILSNKSFVKELLNDARMTIPEGKTFAPADVHAAMIYVQSLGFPVVIKQENSQKNIPSVYPVRDLSQFRKKFAEIAVHGESLIVERYLEGDVLQVFYHESGYINILQAQTGIPFIEVSASQESLKKPSKSRIVYADVTKRYGKEMKPMAKKILSAFPPMSALCFSVLERNTVLEVYHSANRHMEYDALNGKHQKPVADLLADSLDAKSSVS